MPNKTWEAMKIALHNLSPNKKKIVLISDGEYSDNGMASYILSNNFEVKDVLAVIGNTKLVGIIDSDKLNNANISELINILTTENKTAVVRVNPNHISCRISYPIPLVHAKHINGNYEYRYGQEYMYGEWNTREDQNGWGVRLIDTTQTDYVSPLTTIQGHPVTNMSWLFLNSPTTTINLIDWDTSNVTDVHGMFYDSQATDLDLSGFDTSKATDMSGMFVYSQATRINLSSFDTSNVADMSGMFSYSQATSLDLSSFDTSNGTNIEGMFDSSQVKTLKAKSNADAAKYKVSGYFPFGVIVTI